jgi:hypothetical protein
LKLKESANKRRKKGDAEKKPSDREKLQKEKLKRMHPLPTSILL